MWQQRVFTKLLGLQYRIVYKRAPTIELLMPCLGILMDQWLNFLLFLGVYLSGVTRSFKVMQWILRLRTSSLIRLSTHIRYLTFHYTQVYFASRTKCGWAPMFPYRTKSFKHCTILHHMGAILAFQLPLSECSNCSLGRDSRKLLLHLLLAAPLANKQNQNEFITQDSFSPYLFQSMHGR